MGSALIRRRRLRPAAGLVAAAALLAGLGSTRGAAAPAPGGTAGPAGAPAHRAAVDREVNPADRAGADVARPPDPARPGPFRVGYRTLLVPDPDRPGHPLTTSVWYPSLPGGRPGAAPAPDAGTRARYPVTDGVAVPARAAFEGVPAAPGPFPFVVVSHGSAGGRTQLAFLTEALASHGFVVAAPDHPGDTMIDAADGRQASLVDLASDRTLDVSTLISAFTDEDCPLSRLVRADEVAVVGFSFGGLTAVVSSVGFLRAPGDHRVRAVVGIAPATEAVPADLLDRVRVPVLLIGGTMDGAVPTAPNVQRAFDQLRGSRPRYSVIVTGGTHNSFTELCAQAAAIQGRRVPDAVRLRLEVTAAATCRPPAVDSARAQLVTAHYTVAFLARQLRGDTRYAPSLTAAGAERFPEAAFRAID